MARVLLVEKAPAVVVTDIILPRATGIDHAQGNQRDCI